MKVSLLNVPYNVVAEGKGSKLKGNFATWPPLGLGYVAGSLIQAGHDTNILDANALQLTHKEIISYLKQQSPEIIGISSVLATRHHTTELLQALKKEFDVPIFLGGQLASSFPEATLNENPDLDFVTIGEAEQTIAEAISSIEKNKDLSEVNGLCIRTKDTLKRTPPRALIKDLDRLPPPPWDQIDFTLYKPLPLNYKKLPISSYLSSRGCPYAQCTFCFESGEAAPKYRRHSPERTISDIKTLVEKHKVKEICFWDDIFLINEKWIDRFSELWQQEKLDIPFQAYAYVRTTTRTMLEKVAKLGCWNLFYGLESGNQDLLDNIKKGFNLDQARQVIKWTHELGMDTRCSFVLGLPGETPEKAMKTADFAVELDCTFAQFHTCFPEYGTDIYNMLAAEGQIVNTFEGRTNPQYVPPGYKDAKELQAAIKKAYRKFYFRPKYIFKHVKRLTNPRTISQYYQALRFISGIALSE